MEQIPEIPGPKLIKNAVDRGFINSELGHVMEIDNIPYMNDSTIEKEFNRDYAPYTFDGWKGKDTLCPPNRIFLLYRILPKQQIIHDQIVKDIPEPQKGSFKEIWSVMIKYHTGYYTGNFEISRVENHLKDRGYLNLFVRIDKTSQYHTYHLYYDIDNEQWQFFH
jgi:hypothetical protein